MMTLAMRLEVLERESQDRIIFLVKVKVRVMLEGEYFPFRPSPFTNGLWSQVSHDMMVLIQGNSLTKVGPLRRSCISRIR